MNNIWDKIPYDTNNDNHVVIRDFIIPQILTEGSWLAGGSVRRAYLQDKSIRHDFDIFFRSEEFMEEVEGIVRAFCFQREYDSANAITYSGYFKYYPITIQLIHRQYYNSLEETLESFDFDICKAGITFEGTLVIDKNFESYNLTKNIGVSNVLRNLDYTSSHHIGRLFKFLKEGYKISPEDLRMLFSKLDFSGSDEDEAVSTIYNLHRELEKGADLLTNEVIDVINARLQAI